MGHEDKDINQQKNYYDELLRGLIEKTLQAFNIEDQEKFEEQARKTDQDLLCNRIAPHLLAQWAMAGDPVCVGKNFVVVRSWQKDSIKEIPQYNGRLPITIDPGIAFGWAHPTTTVNLDCLEDHWQGGNFLDVGTGTGILAIAAAFLHPEAHIDAYDISKDIIDSASFCAEINGVLDKINLKTADITDYTDNFYDLITANLLPSIFLQVKEELVKKLKPGAKLILSGFSHEPELRTIANFDYIQTISEVSSIEDTNVLNMFEKLGLELIEERRHKQWLGLVMQRPQNK